VQHDEGAGARPVHLGLGLERGRVQDDSLGPKSRSSSSVGSMNIVRAKSAW
jgi:hypothetical protein